LQDEALNVAIRVGCGCKRLITAQKGQIFFFPQKPKENWKSLREASKESKIAFLRFIFFGMIVLLTMSQNSNSRR
jgi:hypothetical protein